MKSLHTKVCLTSGAVNIQRTATKETNSQTLNIFTVILGTSLQFSFQTSQPRGTLLSRLSSKQLHQLDSRKQNLTPLESRSLLPEERDLLGNGVVNKTPENLQERLFNFTLSCSLY